MPLHTKILIGLAIGAALGLFANYIASVYPDPPAVQADPPNVEKAQADRRNADKGRFSVPKFVKNVAEDWAKPIGRVFLRLVIMVVVPLVFSALVLGILELGDIRQLGRVGLKTLGYTMILSFMSVFIGVGLVNLIRPGASLSPEQQEKLTAPYAAAAGDAEAKAAKSKALKDTLLDMLPENPLQEMVGAIDGSSPGNGMLAVMIFALIIGGALTVTPERTGVLIQLLQGLFDVCMTVISFAMRLAPFCVGCLVFAITATIGFDAVAMLIRFVVTVVLGLALQMFVVYSVMLIVVARIPPKQFFRQTSEAIFTAFGTSSSNATLPTSLRVAREELKLRPDVSQFVLTVGSMANQNGTALFEGTVVLFLAQVFGVELTLIQQVTVVMMSVLAGIGTAGVPGGSIPMIIIVLKSVGVPGEGIGIILGVDRILDMCRTTLNVTGDLVLAACVSRSEDRRLGQPIPETAQG
ncbi:MAG: dicarboxylate/amino acid:cation symporter [Planctomycetia bacterium]|nr:dicarboxylate/amino acid:cation symporter [Planctomycetia bacterium]